MRESPALDERPRSWPVAAKRKISPRMLSFLLAALTLSGASAGPLASSPAASSVRVKTSRGEYDLLVYPPRRSDTKPLVLVISGEGGWRHFDELLAKLLADDGFWVGGLDAMKYFWRAQDDRRALAADIRACLGALAAKSGQPKETPVILAGFSFGADLAPWIAGAGGWGNRVAGLLMLGPDEVGSLQFRVLEILGFSSKDHIFAVADALRSAGGTPLVFIHGAKDPHSAAPALARSAPDPKKLIVVPHADHHFSGHEEGLRAALVEGLAWLVQDRAVSSLPVRTRP